MVITPKADAPVTLNAPLTYALPEIVKPLLNLNLSFVFSHVRATVGSDPLSISIPPPSALAPLTLPEASVIFLSSMYSSVIWASIVSPRTTRDPDIVREPDITCAPVVTLP